MVEIIGVKFRSDGRIYSFDPAGKKYTQGSYVIVGTSRGTEIGEVASENHNVPDSQIVGQLKPVIRQADDADIKRMNEKRAKESAAFDFCEKKILERKLEMKLVDVEISFDGTKYLFFFTADGRVDFRELVRDLASNFHTRIELRQIGVRDEAKMMGGIGACGRSLCCNSWLSGFEPVSIKMAKVQNLSLNPSKISGICGRLMCCLKYENSTYMELRRGMPDVGERIKTRDGIAVVVESNILENKIKTRLVVEEKQGDRPEKLSTEYYTYKKQEIKRLEKGHKPKKEDLFEGLDGELLEEIKDLLKD